MPDKKGMTLIEAIVAMAIVAIVSLPLLQIFPTATTIGKRAYNLDKAGTIASSYVEDVRAGNRVLEPGETRTVHYNGQWNEASGQGDFTLSASMEAGQYSSSVDMYFMPSFTGANGEGYNVALTLDGLEAYTVTVEKTPEYFVFSCAETAALSAETAVGRYTVNAVAGDMTGSCVPLAVYTGGQAARLRIVNRTGLEVAVFAFGDEAQALTLVPVDDSDVSLTRLSADGVQYDERIITVTVRGGDEELVSLTTKLFVRQGGGGDIEIIGEWEAFPW